MKTFTILLLSACSLFAQINISNPFYVAGVLKPASGAASCPADGSPDISQTATGDFAHFGRTTGQYYIGQRWPADQPERRICKITVQVDSGAGDTSTKTWVAQIFTMSGNDLNTVVANGTSATVSGNNPASTAELQFTWVTPPTLTASTAHAIVISLASGAAVDSGVYDYLDASTTDLIIGSFALWDDTKALTADFTTKDLYIKIYYYD